MRATTRLVGATVVDATARRPIHDAVVVIHDGRIAAVGPRASVSIPRGVAVVPADGLTIVPGLWDMHTHVTQVEWAPVYLGAGVTTVRDMGNEFEFITALRRAVSSGRALGPRLLAAGLIDGGGANAFGVYEATTPDEGRRRSASITRRASSRSRSTPSWRRRSSRRSAPRPTGSA